MNRFLCAFAVAAATATSSLSYGSILFSETFDTAASSANFNVTSIAGSADAVTYGYNYGANGIPEAPTTPMGAAATSGLFIQANKPAGTTGAINGINVTVASGGLGINFAGEISFSFDMWMNVPSPLTNTTEQALFGINTDGLGVNSRTGASQTGADGVWVHQSNEGGYGNTSTTANSRDTVMYINNTVPTGQRFDNGEEPFLSLFPAGPLAGAPGNGWVHVDVIEAGGLVTVKYNGVQVLSATNSGPTSGSVFVGYQDPFSGSVGTSALFVVFDNIVVAPEPGAALLSVLGAVALAAGRRR